MRAVLPMMSRIIFLFFPLTNSELKFVFEHFRHGARGPWTGLDEKFYDPIYKQYWPGSGELTGLGMRQHYLLGHRNKQRYKHFLSPVYDPREISVISTDVNRTIMSAFSQLQGLYPHSTGPLLTPYQIEVAVPPNNNTFFVDEKEKLQNMALPFQIQVIPIHIFQADHEFMASIPKVCPPTVQIIAEAWKKQVVVDFMTEFNKTYGKQLKEFLGKPNTDFIFNYEEIYPVCDNFLSTYTDGRDISELENQGVNLTQFANDVLRFKDMDMLDIMYGDKDMMIGRAMISPTMKTVISWMDRRINHDMKGDYSYDYKDPKMIMYSGHDTTLSAMQAFMHYAFNISNSNIPFASSAFFELYLRDGMEGTHAKEEDYYVLYIFNDNIRFNMTYTEFKAQIKNSALTNDQIAQFCNFTTYHINYFMISTIILSILAVILLGISIIFIRKRSISSEAEEKHFFNVDATV